jgi:hypothetical protein
MCKYHEVSLLTMSKFGSWNNAAVACKWVLRKKEKSV